MFPQLHFTDDLPARPGCSPCLSPVWRRWPLTAAHSSSKLLFACRHLKSITLTNPLSLELRYPWLHRELMYPSEIQQDLRRNWFCTCGSGNSRREELPQRGRWLPKLPYTHRCTMTNLYMKTNMFFPQQLLPKSPHVWAAAVWVEEQDEGGIKSRG